MIVFYSSSFSGSGFPEGRQQFSQSVDGLLRQSLEHVRQVVIGVDVLQLAATQ
jgi:hypothetical protein